MSVEVNIQPDSHPQFLGSVQCLRGLAATLVVIRHTCIFLTGEHQSIAAFPIGPFGVDLFFIISGFVMSMTGGQHTASQFFRKRIARIVPLYWFVSLAKLALVVLVGGLGVIDERYFLQSLFFIPAHNRDGDIAPFVFAGWTLNFEMFFYLLCTAALWLNRRFWIRLVLVEVGLCVLVGSALRWKAIEVAPLVLLSDILLEFAFGMVAGEAWKRGLRFGTPFNIFFLVLPSILTLLIVPMSFPYTPFRSLTWGLPALALFYAVIQYESVLRSFRVGQRIGDASYSIYLIHPLAIPIVGAVLAKLGLGAYIVSLPSICVVCLLVGFANYYLIERRINRFATRLLGASGPKTAT